MTHSDNEAYEPVDRRPIAARRWSIWQPIVHRMVKAGISANAISIAGMFSGILAGLAVAATSIYPEQSRWLWIASSVFIQLRLLANLLDGMVAIEGAKASVVGELYNEVPDRVSDSAILIGAGFALGGNPFFGCLAALAAMFTAYVRAIGKSVGAGQIFCGPMAKQQRMALLTVAALYLAFAPPNWLPHWNWLIHWHLMSIVLVVITLGSVVTGLRRLLKVANHCRTPQLPAKKS